MILRSRPTPATSTTRDFPGAWTALPGQRSRKPRSTRSGCLDALTILNVAYPFAPVGPDAVGGAEQISERPRSALVEHGYRSIVVACEGSASRRPLARSRGAGLLRTARAGAPGRAGPGDRGDETAFRRRSRSSARDRFSRLLPRGRPTLVTLHLPLGLVPIRKRRPPGAPISGCTAYRAANATRAGGARLLGRSRTASISRRPRPPRRARFRSVPRPDLPGKGRPSRDRRGRAEQTSAGHRRTSVPLRRARALFRRRGRAAARRRLPLRRAARLAPKAPLSRRGAMPRDPEPRSRDELARRDGGARLRHARCGFPRRGLAGDCRATARPDFSSTTSRRWRTR